MCPTARPVAEPERWRRRLAGENMRAIGLNSSQCRAALQGYDDEIKEIMQIVEEPHALTHFQIEEARTLLANLKDCLKRDVARRRSDVGRRQMSKVEAAIFEPAVHQAHVDLRIRLNSRPSREWYSQLYGAQLTIRHALANLKDL